MALAVDLVPDLHLVGAGCGAECFPFYAFESDGKTCHENITDWALEHFRGHYNDKEITKWDIFYYVYAVLHHPEYRVRYAENLKRELPRIPLAKDLWGISKAGKELARLHIDYEKLEPYPLRFIETGSSVAAVYRPPVGTKARTAPTAPPQTPWKTKVCATALEGVGAARPQPVLAA
jgi:predicted helicase